MWIRDYLSFGKAKGSFLEEIIKLNFKCEETIEGGMRCQHAVQIRSHTIMRS